ncbi:hypothetical protein [Arthrobacter sp. A2-55]|uniref:hypothetical protein n=1 Tax=Arthrobacter sp. A2-55 TaxID=2897337 RepID=UPI0021CD36A8|nr:hypothetical protein [Arthrobacter sp. A2-55]MCU6479052.1 hypothetical protein [Arthrobacter sp. A2-55]
MNTNNFHSTEDPHDKQIIENLLDTTGMNDPVDAELLTPALMHVRALAHGPQPTPHGELAALLTTPRTAQTTDMDTVSSLEGYRRKRHIRLVIAATALSLSLGASAAVAAANPDFRETIHNTVTTLVKTLTSAPNEQPPSSPPRLYTSGPATPAPVQPTRSGTTVSNGPAATPPAAFEPQQHKSTPGPQPNIGSNRSLSTRHPAPQAAVTPQPTGPVQPAQPGTGSTLPRQPVAVPPQPTHAPAGARPTTPHPPRS